LLDELRKLVVRCLQGEPAAMVDLVDRYKGQVFGLCLRMLGQRQDAEDAVQETFLRVLKSLGRWDASRDFEPWLMAIAGNRCRTALAARRRRPMPQTLEDDTVPDADDGQRSAEQLAEEVQLALADLRFEYRQAFVLFHEQEMEYAAIAQVMDVPVGTIKTWVHRARRELMERLRLRGIHQETRNVLRQV
jgi:RNA polymerase sigma-70 factor (ECF subfamily)